MKKYVKPSVENPILFFFLLHTICNDMLLTWELCTTVMCMGGLELLPWYITESVSRPGIRQVDSNCEYCSIHRRFPPKVSTGNVSLQKIQPLSESGLQAKQIYKCQIYSAYNPQGLPIQLLNRPAVQHHKASLLPAAKHVFWAFWNILIELTV